ncbi:hypothetical protein GCM10010317_065880 [Streptomyces mirabilis]|nr:hypothetical protein GCM10010317_065880 [Streptomyces mirabilis]
MPSAATVSRPAVPWMRAIRPPVWGGAGGAVVAASRGMGADMSEDRGEDMGGGPLQSGKWGMRLSGRGDRGSASHGDGRRAVMAYGVREFEGAAQPSTASASISMRRPAGRPT